LIYFQKKKFKEYHRNSGQGMELYSINDLEKVLTKNPHVEV